MSSVLSKSNHCIQGHLDFSLMLSSRRSIVLHLAFQSVIHFGLILGDHVRSFVFIFIYLFFCMEISSCSGTIYRKDDLFSIYYFWAFVKRQLTVFMRICFWILFCSTDKDSFEI